MANCSNSSTFAYLFGLVFLFFFVLFLVRGGGGVVGCFGTIHCESSCID